MRFFRSDAATYESVRLQLDAAWGHPSNVATTCIDPVDVAPKDSAGRVLLAVLAHFCEYPAVAQTLPGLLASGAVEEISEAEYQTSLVRPPMP